MNFSGQLHDTRIAGRRDRPEGRCADRRVRRPKRRRVRDVEDFRAQLQRLARGERHAAHQGDVEIAIARAAHRVARARANRELRRRRKRACVEPPADRPLVGRKGWIPDQIGTLRAESRERIVVRRLRDGDRDARLQREHARQRPVVDESAQHTGSATAPVRAEGNVPHRGRDEHVRNIAGRVVALEPAIEAVGDRDSWRRVPSESMRRTPRTHRPPASSACS